MEAEDKQEEVNLDKKEVQDQPLSKNQLKKLKKRENFLAIRKETRKKQKEKEKLKKALNKERGIKSTKPSRKQLYKNKVNPENADISIAIDLNFDDYMVDKDIASCTQQLMRVYTANRRVKVPLPIHFTSLKEGGKVHNHLMKNDGFHHWDVFKNEKHFSEIFEKDKIVYLTSESETTLNELEKGTCYVIGGLVDHNKHKGLTHNAAIKEGYRTARLPITESIVLHSRAVLTINQVAEIMIAKSEGKSWKDVFLQVLPRRKIADVKDDGEEKKEEEKN